MPSGIKRIHTFYVISTQMVLTFIQIPHLPLDFTCTGSEFFTKIFRFSLSTHIKCSRCLGTCWSVHLNIIHRCHTHLTQWFSKCCSWTSGISITWMHMLGPDLRPSHSETLGMSSQQSVFLYTLEVILAHSQIWVPWCRCYTSSFRCSTCLCRSYPYYCRWYTFNKILHVLAL